MTDEEKALIDNMTLEEMLFEWRFAPLGHFQNGDSRSDYFIKVMNAKREADPAAWTAASKALAW